MKKILFALALVFTMSFGAVAQMDSFLGDDVIYRPTGPALPEIPWEAVGLIIADQAAQEEPLGEGLLILTALGAGYGFLRKKSKN